MEATTQYFGKWFFINRSQNFIALLNFYVRHLGVKITGPYCVDTVPYRVDAHKQRHTLKLHIRFKEQAQHGTGINNTEGKDLKILLRQLKCTFPMLKGLSHEMDLALLTCMVSLVLSLHKGRGQFFKFCSCSYNFIMPKVFCSRLMRVCVGLIMLAACTQSRFP